MTIKQTASTIGQKRDVSSPTWCEYWWILPVDCILFLCLASPPFSAHSPSSISSWSLPRYLSHALQYVKKFPLGSWRPDLALGRAQLLLPKSRPQELESPAVRGSTVPGPPRGTLTCLPHRWEKRGPSYALVQRLRM